MIIDCLSDLHGELPSLEGGDLLIIAGDIFALFEYWKYFHFLMWLDKQEYKKKIVVAGNHDVMFQEIAPTFCTWDYLCSGETEYEGLKIWGSPFTKRFKGMNAHCDAFTVESEEDLEEKWRSIPPDVDILITHCPAYGMLDEVKKKKGHECFGSKSLLRKVIDIKPKLHVFGHIHGAYGKVEVAWGGTKTIFVNASLTNEEHKCVNKPVRVIL